MNKTFQILIIDIYTEYIQTYQQKLEDENKLAFYLVNIFDNISNHGCDRLTISVILK